MSPIRPLAITAALVIGAGLGGCSTLEKINPFDSSKGNKVVASQGQRIPLVAFNQKVEVAEALKGQQIVLPALELNDSWPQPGGPQQGWVDNVAAAQNFQVAWRTDIGRGTSDRFHITGTPVVADGKVFALDAEATVAAVNADTGQVIWRTDVAVKTRRDKEAFGGGVAYANGKLYVSSGYRFVAALDAASGRVLWRTATDAPIHDAPAVGGGKVFAIDVNDQMVSPDTCGWIVTRDDAGTPIRIQGDPDHPYTRGWLCAKVNRYLEFVLHPERLRTPLRRTGPTPEPVAAPAGPRRAA
jgi:hypothetical protein